VVGNLNSARVLITGGAGYLGARIGEFLSELGYDVFLGSRNPFSKNLVDGCNHVITDWDDPAFKFCEGFDLIIHAAGMNAGDCAKDPCMAVRFNGEITARFVEKAALYGCNQFFYLSTVHVYKAPLVGNFNEGSPTLNDHPYAISRLYGEQAVLNVVRNSSLRGAVLRLSNCFGPPASENSECWGLVLNQFVRDAMVLGRITIDDDFLTRRDFLPISELNNVLSKIIGVSELEADILNISTGQSRSLLDIASLVSSTVAQRVERDVEVIKNRSSLLSYGLVIKNKALESMGVFVKKDLGPEIESLISYLQKSN
jgi:UDP-glucose 4-epimerase